MYFQVTPSLFIFLSGLSFIVAQPGFFGLPPRGPFGGGDFGPPPFRGLGGDFGPGFGGETFGGVDGLRRIRFQGEPPFGFGGGLDGLRARRLGGVRRVGLDGLGTGFGRPLPARRIFRGGRLGGTVAAGNGIAVRGGTTRRRIGNGLEIPRSTVLGGLGQDQNGLFVDPVTGRRVRVLTNNAATNVVNRRTAIGGAAGVGGAGATVRQGGATVTTTRGRLPPTILRGGNGRLIPAGTRLAPGRIGGLGGAPIGGTTLGGTTLTRAGGTGLGGTGLGGTGLGGATTLTRVAGPGLGGAGFGGAGLGGTGLGGTGLGGTTFVRAGGAGLGGTAAGGTALGGTTFTRTGALGGTAGTGLGTQSSPTTDKILLTDTGLIPPNPRGGEPSNKPKEIIASLLPGSDPFLDRQEGSLQPFLQVNNEQKSQLLGTDRDAIVVDGESFIDWSYFNKILEEQGLHNTNSTVTQTDISTARKAVEDIARAAGWQGREKSVSSVSATSSPVGVQQNSVGVQNSASTAAQQNTGPTAIQIPNTRVSARDLANLGQRSGGSRQLMFRRPGQTQQAGARRSGARPLGGISGLGDNSLTLDSVDLSAFGAVDAGNGGFLQGADRTNQLTG